MKKYNERLEELRDQIARKNRLEGIVKDLKAQKQELEEKVSELETAAAKEQADVDKLEGRSLAAFYYTVIGKKDAMLDKEREEAYAARVKYDAAVKEQEAVNADLSSAEAELRSLRWSEQDYHQTLQEKAKALRTAGGVAAAQIIGLEEKILQIENQKKELDEAIAAGKAAMSIADKILTNLNSAERWGTWDLVGGGLISDLAKHSELDEAQGYVESLQVQLRRFKTELTDVTVHADIQVNVDGFLRFADYFYDGLFADWAVLDKIGQSQTQIHKIRGQIGNVLSKLDELLRVANGEQNMAKVQLDELVVQAK